MRLARKEGERAEQKRLDQQHRQFSKIEAATREREERAEQAHQDQMRMIREQAEATSTESAGQGL